MNNAVRESVKNKIDSLIEADTEASRQLARETEEKIQAKRDKLTRAMTGGCRDIFAMLFNVTPDADDIYIREFGPDVQDKENDPFNDNEAWRVALCRIPLGGTGALLGYDNSTTYLIVLYDGDYFSWVIGGQMASATSNYITTAVNNAHKSIIEFTKGELRIHHVPKVFCDMYQRLGMTRNWAESTHCINEYFACKKPDAYIAWQERWSLPLKVYEEENPAQEAAPSLFSENQRIGARQEYVDPIERIAGAFETTNELLERLCEKVSQVRERL